MYIPFFFGLNNVPPFLLTQISNLTIFKIKLSYNNPDIYED